MSNREMTASRTMMAERAFRKIMLAVDGPEDSGRAVELAIRLAILNRAELTIIHVASLAIPPPSPPGLTPPLIMPSAYFQGERELTKRRLRWLERLVQVAESRGVKAHMDLIEAQDSIATELTRRASQEEADLVIVGKSGRKGLERFIHGSVSNSVSQRADCPVLVVRGDREEAPDRRHSRYVLSRHD
jgi:nucleotide-binding universal stress UspA family protein